MSERPDTQAVQDYLLNLQDRICAALEAADGAARFREDAPFPDEVEVNRRVAYLMRIHDALLTYFPRNPEMRNLWVRRGNRQFGRRAPLAVMVEDGESGLIAVLSHLDCTFAWDLTGSKAEYGSA